MLGFRHTDKEGNIKLIAELETSHLLNIIRVKMRECNKAFVASQQQQSPYKVRLYGFNPINEERAVDFINTVLDSVGPYIIEAFFRIREIQNDPVMADILGLMQSFMQREGRLDLGPNRPQLNSSYMETEAVDFEDWRDPEEGDR